MPDFIHVSRPLTFVGQLKYMHKHQGHSSKLGHVMFLSGDHYWLCAPKPSPVSSAALMAAWSHTWGQRGRKTIREGMKPPPPEPPALVPVSAQKQVKRIPSPKSMAQGRESRGCEPLILQGTSKLLCTSTAPASLLLCLPEADRKEGAQLLASHPSVSQLAECAGQEA